MPPAFARSRAVAALLTAALSLTLMAVMPQEAELSPGWRTPIIALELATSPADVAFLAGEQAAPLREAVDFGHAFDMVFPFAYAGLLLLTLLVSASAAGLRIAGSVVALVVVGADVRENLVLLELTERLSQAAALDDLFSPLAAATWTKWIGIAALTALIGAARWSTARGRAALRFSLLALTLVAAIVRTPLTGELMALAVVITIASFVVGALLALRGSATRADRT